MVDKLLNGAGSVRSTNPAMPGAQPRLWPRQANLFVPAHFSELVAMRRGLVLPLSPYRLVRYAWPMAVVLIAVAMAAAGIKL